LFRWFSRRGLWARFCPCSARFSYAELGAAIPEAGGEYALFAARIWPGVGISFWVDALDCGTAIVGVFDCGGIGSLFWDFFCRR